MREDSVASKENVQNAQDSRAGATPNGAGSDELNWLDNPCYPAFDLLLARLLAHEEVLKIVPRMIPSDGNGVVESTTSAADGDLMADSLQGFVADICEMRRHGFVRSFPTLRFPKVAKEARSRITLTFRRRCCAWIVAQSFESFREFVEEIDRTISEKQQEAACQPDRASTAIEPASSRNRWRELKEVRRRIREAAPALKECEERNSRRVNLGSWLRTLVGIRHAIVHSEGVIRPEEWQKLNTGGPKVRFPGSETAKHSYVLDITPDVTQTTIERLREYGLAIYKAVSAAVGCPVTLYDPDKGITVSWR